MRVLNVEDSERDSALLTRHIKGAGYDVFLKRVETAEAMKAALSIEEWDLILCDYSMPRFSALAALEVLRASNIDVPFIIISGTVGEEIAVKALLSGANDYIPKGNLARLIPAIQRELQQAESRRAKRKAEEALKASEAELRALFDAMNDVIIVFDYEGRHLKVAPTNPKHIYSKETDRIGKTLHEIFPPDTADFILTYIQICLDESRTLNIEHGLSMDGTERWFNCTVTPMTDDSVVWVARDVTQRKRAEDELRESEERFAGAFEHAPIGVALVLPDGRWLKVNRALCDLLGYSEAELLDLTFQDITHRDDLDDDLTNVNQLLSREIPHYQMEKRYIHRQGHPVFVHLHVSLVRYENGDPRYFISQIQDITDRKADEHQLQLHSLILNSIGQAVIVTDSAGTITYWNSLAEKMYGWNSSEVLGRNVIDVTPTRMSRSQGVDILETLKRGQSWSGEFSVQHRDGTPFPIFVTNTPLINAEGRVESIVGISLDITERKQSEKALFDSEERYRDLVENAIDIIYTHDLQGNYTSVNKAVEVITGFTTEEVLSMNLSERVAPEHREKLGQIVAAKLAGTSSPAEEMDVIAKDGHRITLEVNAKPIFENGVPVGVQGIARDITDRKLADAELQEKSALLEAQLNSSIDGILVVDEDGRQIIKNQRFADLFNIPENIASDPDDAKQVQWVIGTVKDPDTFVEKVDYLYSHPNEVSRDEIELTNGTFLDRYSAPVKGKDNKHYGRIWTFRDVTKRKLAEDTLRESEMRLRTIIDTEPECVKLLARDGSLLEMNPAGLRMIEADSFDEVGNSMVVGLIAEQDRKAFRQLIEKVFRGESGRLEFQIVGLKGTRRWLDTHASPLLNASGEITALLSITRDVTESKLATEALRESDENFHQVADNITDAFWIRSPDMKKIHYISPAYEKIWGRTAKANYAHSDAWYDFIVPADRQRVKEAYASLMNDEPNIEVEYRILRPDGEVRWVRARGFQVRNSEGDLIRLAGIVTDNTERKHALEALGESEMRYRSVVETAPDVILTIDESSSICFINPAAERIFGYGIDEMIDSPITMLMPDRLRHLHDTGFERYLQTEVKHVSWDNVEATGLHKSGREIPITISFSEYVQNGRRYFTGIIRDISDRKQAMEALQESEERYRELVENAVDIIYTQDLDGNYTSINNAAERITGYSKDEARTINMSQVVAPGLLDRAKEMIAAKIAGEESSAFELEIVTKDGRPVHLDINTSVIYEKGVATGIQGIARDITERKVLEAQLELQRAELEIVLNSIGEGVHWIDLDGRIKFENPIAVAMLGYQVHEVIGKPSHATIHHTHSDGSAFPRSDCSIYATLKDGLVRRVADEVFWRKDGTSFPVEYVCTPIFDHNGEPQGSVVVFSDITERKLAEKEIELTMQRLNAAQRIGKIGDWTWDKASGAITWSREIFSIVGRDLELGPPRSYEEQQEYYGAESRAVMDEKIALVLETGRPQEYQMTVLRTDGTHVHAQAMCESQTDEAGEVCGLRGTLQDISARRMAEAALRESEFRYHSLFENMLEGYAYCQTIFEGDKLIDFVYTEVNGAFEGLTGMKDVVGKRISDLIPGGAEIHPEIFETYGRVALTGRTERFETYIDPLKRWLAITIYSSDREHFVGVFDNITERKLAEARLAELRERTERRERMLTTMLSSMSDFAQIYDRDGRLLFVNQPVLDLWGRTLDEVIGKTFHELDYPADLAAKLQRQVKQVHRTKKPITDESPFILADGGLAFYEYIFSPAIGPDGIVDFVVGSTRDVTERRRAQEELSEANQRAVREYEHLLTRVSTLAVALGSANDLQEIFRKLRDFALFSTSMNGLFISFFDAARNMRTPVFAWSEGAEVDVSTLPEMEMNSAPHSRAVATGEIVITDDFQSAVMGQPVINVGLDANPDLPQSSLVVPMAVMGRIVGAVEVQSTELAAFGPEHATALRMAANLAANAIENVRLLETERLQAEQLRQSQKMEAVGVLAGGIAHDFNNLLTAINGYSDLTLKKMEHGDPLRHNIEEVKNAGTRAADLTSQLLAFSRKQVLRPTVLSLNTVVSNIERMLRRIMRESIELRVVLDPQLGHIRADAGQIEQVIMNLAINARDAMPGGGTLSVKTTNEYLDEDYVSQYLAVRPGNFIRMTVTDTGEGMDAATMQHIFEPFFTTKAVGMGTGLGLSTVYGIVKQSGGDIMVYSELGHGTTFKIYLPSVDESIQKPRWTGERGGKFSGTETVLLVEDEDVVRNLVREILTDNGYRVLEAVGGEEGLRICSTYTEPIHILLTDVVMPKMGGSELMANVVKLLPNIKVLFMSGYPDDSAAHRSITEAKIAFIEKPFTPEALRRKVREVLDH